MMENQTLSNLQETRYAKCLSSLFCSVAIMALIVLSLLNNGTLDLYTLSFVIRIAIPGGLSFWIIGYIIGMILDKFNITIADRKIKQEKKAYEIPSMFSSNTQENAINDLEIQNTDNEFGEL